MSPRPSGRSSACWSQLNACWNNAYRKVFGMHVWESVKILQFLCERLDFKHIIYMYLEEISLFT